MSENNGGSAFPPNAGWRDDDPNFRGMTLRDYFAAKAMQFCSAGDPHARARQAYEMADAMLVERTK